MNFIIVRRKLLPAYEFLTSRGSRIVPRSRLEREPNAFSILSSSLWQILIVIYIVTYVLFMITYNPLSESKVAQVAYERPLLCSSCAHFCARLIFMHCFARLLFKNAERVCWFWGRKLLVTTNQTRRFFFIILIIKRCWKYFLFFSAKRRLSSIS